MKTELSLSTLQGQGVFRDSELPADSEVSRKSYTMPTVKVDGDERTFASTMTTPIEDREGEVVVTAGMDTKQYSKNPVLCWSHTYSVLPVGKAVEVEASPTGLVGKFKVATTGFANDVWQLIKDGMLNAVSIGFIRMQTYKRGQPGFVEACKQYGVEITATLTRITTKSVLVETSLVCTPCNREALVYAVASKGLTEIACKLGVEVVETGDMGSEDLAIKGSEAAKPYPTEHAARQENPDAFRKFRRRNGAFGPGIDAIYGIDSNGKAHVASIRFDATKFTVTEAQAWLKAHDYKTDVEAATPHKADEPADPAENTTETPATATEPAPEEHTAEPSAPPAKVCTCGVTCDSEGTCPTCSMKEAISNPPPPGAAKDATAETAPASDAASSGIEGDPGTRSDEGAIPEDFATEVEELLAEIEALELSGDTYTDKRHAVQDTGTPDQVATMRDGTKVFLVDGSKIERTKRMDFVEGDNGEHDAKTSKGALGIPADEIWIDACVSQRSDCRKHGGILAHEAAEKKLMAKGLTYDKAHPIANTVERKYLELGPAKKAVAPVEPPPEPTAKKEEVITPIPVPVAPLKVLRVGPPAEIKVLRVGSYSVTAEDRKAAEALASGKIV